MARLRTIWFNLIDSLWFVPGLLTVAGAILAALLVEIDNTALAGIDPRTRWWLFGGGPAGAAGVLTAIATGIITVTGVVFSVTIVALQLASSQFTPRVLRQFTADRANQIVLGVFIGTFTYTLLVLRTVRAGPPEEFVPNLAVTGAVALALVSIGCLIYFVDHAARSIQAAVIIDNIATETLRVLRRTFPDRVHEAADETVPSAEDPTTRLGPARQIGARQAGYVQLVDVQALTDLATSGQLTISMAVEIGRYVLPGDTIMSVWPAERVDDLTERALRDALVVGLERTTHQDLKLGIIELMDIAVKAMSPSVNDPTTALNAIDRLGEILLDMAWRRRGAVVEVARDGRLLLITLRPDLDDTIGIAYDQIRHYASDNPTVAIAMVRMLGRLADLAPHGRVVFAKYLQQVVDSAERRISDPVDRERLDRAARAAMRLASHDDRYPGRSETGSAEAGAGSHQRAV